MRKLDLACGGSCAEGFEGADIAKVNDRVTHVFDLMQFPWPFEDGSFDELRSSHHVEHIPQAFYTPDPRFPIAPNMTAVAEGPHSVSLFLKFFAETWRILKPGGKMQIVVPYAHSNRAFQDPTHCRFIVEESFDYLDATWRKANGLEHAAYAMGALNFPVAARVTRPQCNADQAHALSIMPEIVRGPAIQKYWNTISDLDVTLVKAPVPVAEPVEIQVKEVATATA